MPLTNVGLEELLTAVYCQRRQLEPQGKLLEEINSLSLFDGDLKRKTQIYGNRWGVVVTTVVSKNITDDSQEIIEILENVPGITRAHHRDFKSSNPVIRLRDGSTVKTWKNPFWC